jgi:hypothetical protein
MILDDLGFWLDIIVFSVIPVTIVSQELRAGIDGLLR